MRKIEDKVVRAFVYRRAASLDNTRTDGDSLFLHGNKIAKWEDGKVKFTLAGWDSRTTCSRLNAMLQLLHANRYIWHKNFEPRFGDASINSHSWYWV